MATENCNTYHLPAAVAASLRTPRITYPNGVVPRATIAACIPSQTIRQHPELGSDMPLGDILDLLCGRPPCRAKL